MLSFVDSADMTIMGTGEHFNCGDLTWDPTGRYIVSAVSHWRQQMDTGYFVWSFQGKLLQKHMMERFYQFAWRPRPKTLLREAHYAHIRKQWKTFQSRFEAQDKVQQSKASEEEIATRRRLAAAFGQYRQRKEAEQARRAAKLLALRPGAAAPFFLVVG